MEQMTLITFMILEIEINEYTMLLFLHTSKDKMIVKF